MKRCTILLFILLISFASKAQLGFRLGYSLENSLIFDGHYKKDRNSFHLGINRQFGGQKGKAVTDRLSNYGTTSDGSGNYTLMFDVGYGYWLNKHIVLGGEISLGSRSYFTNYVDNRFSGDRFHYIDKSEGMFGAGIKGTYLINKGFGIFLGYNSVYKANFGLNYTFITD